MKIEKLKREREREIDKKLIEGVWVTKKRRKR